MNPQQAFDWWYSATYDPPITPMDKALKAELASAFVAGFKLSETWIKQENKDGNKSNNGG